MAGAAASSSRSNSHAEGTPLAESDAESLALPSSSRSARQAHTNTLSMGASEMPSGASSRSKSMAEESVSSPVDDADSGLFIRSDVRRGARARKRRIIGCSSFKCCGEGGCTHQLQSSLPVRDFFLPLPAGDDPTL